MPNIQVTAERKRDVIEAHRIWLGTLPRRKGQIGGTMGLLVEGPPIYTPGEVTTYSDFDSVRFVMIDQAFLDYLRAEGISFTEN